MANTNLKWILGGALALAAGIGVVSRVQAGPWHGHRAQSAAEVQVFMERRAEHLLDAVDADDAQREQVEAILAKNAPQMFALMQEGRALRQELKAALLAERVDRTQIALGKQKLDALAQRMANLGVDGLASVAEVLTPAQRKQIADKLTHFHD
ncbi:MAG: periplasmic heavy metal sensor [Myxococcales bacterium]